MLSLLPALLSLVSIQDPTQEPAQSALEARFAKRMTGCKMVGKFTLRGSKKAPQTDTYTIAKVMHVKGSKWRFYAKIEYAGKSVTVPLLVDVKWAGDTPMIQVTKMAVPLLGTYSARVLIYGDEYAGVWSGTDHGGQMYGKIVRAKPKVSGPNWPTWRGVDGTAVAKRSHPPTEWDSDSGKNIKWTRPIPGRGSSSPIVWGSRVFVTTAVPIVADGQAPPVDRGGFVSARPTLKHAFLVMAIDRNNGEVIWKKTVNTVVPHEGGHSTATQVSNSSIADADHLYAYFGSRGLFCMTHSGDIKWSKQFGKMRTAMSFGEGSSPALYKNTIVVPWDHEGPSFLIALDTKTGDEKWKVKRRQGTTWATPTILEVDGKPQVIVPGRRASRGYDLATGAEIWSVGGLTSNPIPSPLHRDGHVYLMSGFQGSALQVIHLAGAKGNLRGTEHVVWNHSRNTPYTPTGVIIDDYLYFLRSNNGVLSCLDAKSGKIYYEGKRLRRVGSTYSSIVGAGSGKDARIYVTGRRGWTKVLKVGPEYEEIASNRIKDTMDATAAIAGDEIYMRGWKALYCIANK